MKVFAAALVAVAVLNVVDSEYNDGHYTGHKASGDQSGGRLVAEWDKQTQRIEAANRP